MSNNSLLIDVVRPELIDINSLPFSPYQGADTVVKAPCIYFVMNPLDVVIYVGKTQRSDRFKNHHRLMDFNAHKAVKVAYWQQSSYLYLSVYEGQFISKLDGLLNVSENKKHPVLPTDEPYDPAKPKQPLVEKLRDYVDPKPRSQLSELDRIFSDNF